MPKTRLVVASAVTSLTLALGGVLAAAPAIADSPETLTPGWMWEDISAGALNISDVGSHYTNYLGTGVDLDGFGDLDAFDGFLQNISLTFGADTLNPTMAPVSENYVDNGLSTIVASGSVDFPDVGPDTNVVTVTATLEIQNSTARWTFAYATDNATNDILDSTSVAIYGALGSDSWTKYLPLTATTMVSNDTLASTPNDPILGYALTGTTPTFSVVDGNDQVNATFAAATTTSTLTIAFADWNPCDYDAVLAAMQTSIVPTLATGFGLSTVGLAQTNNCLLVAPPVGFTGTTDQLLPVTESAALLANWGYLSGNPSIYLNMAPISVPADLSVALVFDAVTHAPSIHLTGSGVGTVSLLFYDIFDGEGTFTGYPLVVTFDVAHALAATGVDATPGLLIAGGFSVIGVALLLVATTRRWAPKA